MKKARLIISITLILGFSVYAQEKPAPPPSKITLPSDTTKVENKPDKKVDAKKPEIELPDVLILGRDRLVRVAGEKETVGPESPSLLIPGSPYEPVTKWFQDTASKPGQDRKIGPTRLGWASLQIGGYTTVLADAGHWQRFNTGSYQIRGWLDRSSGQYNNSDYSQGGFSANSNYMLAPRVSGTTQVSYALYNRGLQALTFQDPSRQASSGKFDTSFKYDIQNQTSAQVQFQIGGTSVNTDTNSTELDATSDFWYNMNAAFSTQLSGIRLSVVGDYSQDTYDLNDSTDTKNALGTITLEALTSFSNKLTAAVGLSHQTIDSELASQNPRLSPYGKINFMPAHQIGITAKIYTGYEFKSFTQLWQENPYIAHQISLIPEETKFGLKAECYIDVIPGLKLRASFQRAWMENAYYWERDGQINFINLLQIKDPVLTELEVGVTAELSERTRLEASFISYSDKIDNNDLFSNIDRIPYRPEFRIPVRLSVDLVHDIYVSVFANIYGKRPNALNSLSRLPSFGVLDVTLTKDFKKFSIFATGKNILDTDHVLWENYQETGAYLLLGLRAKF